MKKLTIIQRTKYHETIRTLKVERTNEESFLEVGNFRFRDHLFPTLDVSHARIARTSMDRALLNSKNHGTAFVLL